jgi:hypothetical protein
MPPLDPIDLIGRITLLERRQRWLQPLAGLAMVVLPAFLLAVVPLGPSVVQAERVELLNPKGEIRATLSADTAGIVLMLFDTSGHASGSLRLTADPRLAVLDGSGRELAGLGAPRAHLLVQ